MASFIEFLETDPTGQIGAIAENGSVNDSGKCDTVSLNAGLMVLRDQSDGKIRVPASAADVEDLDGMVIFDPLHPPFSDTFLFGDGEIVPFMRTGRGWADAEEAMALGDGVWVRHTAKGGNTVLGKVRNDGDPNAATAATVTVVDADDGVYEITVGPDAEGADQTFSFTGSTSTAAQIGTGLSAAIDAHPDFVSPDGTTAVVVTSVVATTAITVSNLTDPEPASPNLELTTQGSANPTAALASNMKVAAASSTSGATKIRVRY